VAETHLDFRRLKPVVSAVAAFSIVATAVMAFSFVGSSQRVANAAPLSLVFETVSNTRVNLGTLASRSQCGPLTRQGVGPFTMSGTDASTGTAYSYNTDSAYTAGAQSRESREATTNISYGSVQNQTVLSRSGVLELNSYGTISFNNSCSYNGSNVTVYGSAFGPQVYTQAFQATAGQALSFDWAAVGGGDDYEVYAFLVKVANSSDYGSASSTTVLAYGRGKNQGWTTSTGLIPDNGWYRFRFVNGSYDRTGGFVLGAKMYIDPRVLVGEANNISFAPLSDRVNNAGNQSFTIAASTSSNAIVNFTSSTTARCTVGASTLSNGVSQATVSLVSGQTGLCTISANSASTGEFATAATVTRSFTLLAAPTAPTNSGGTSVTGTAAVGQTMTAVDGSWADGGSAITSTSYQWQSCLASSCSWANIAGANDASIVLGSSDVGRRVRVQVTKTNGVGSTSVFSSESATVAKGNQAPLTISSTSATYGQVLTVTTTGGSGTGTVTFAKVSGTCSLVGSQLTPGDAGSACVITATKAGDAAFNPVTSSQASITTLRAPQSTPLVVTSTSGTFGSPLTLTTSGGSGTGAVSWTVVSGACTVSGATLTPTAAGNNCVVRATKSSDANYLVQNSQDTQLTFARTSQTSTLVVTSTSGTFGTDLVLTSSGGSGTGAVSWTVVSGACTVSGVTLTPTAAGSSCTVRASKADDDNYLAQTSVDTAITFARSAQETLLVTSATGTFGTDLVLTTSGGSGIGAVSWTVVSGSCTVSGTTLTPTSAGNSCIVRATKAADTNYLSRLSADTTVVFAQAAQTSPIVVTSTTGTFGSDLVLTSSGGSGTGAVSWTVVSGACTVSGATLTPTAAGNSCVVRATKSSDTNYLSLSSTDTALSFARGPQTVGITVASMSLVYGRTDLLTASGGSGTGAFIFNYVSGPCTVSGQNVLPTDIGVCTVSATRSGDANYLDATSAAASLSIARRPLSFVVTANNKPYDASPTATVSVGSLSGVVNGDDVSINPDRIIATFIDDEVGQNKVVVVTLQSNILQGADAAKYVHVVPQNPRANIVRATQTGVTFVNAESMTVGDSMQLQISGGQSSGTATYSVSSGDCVVTGNQLTATRGGMTCVVAATKAGDSRYNSITVNQTIVVNKIVQQLTVQSGITTAVVGGTHVVSVTSDAFLAPTIAIANSSASVCSISADVVTFLAPGTCLVSVSQAGTDRYSSAAVSQSIEVTAAPLPPAPSTTNVGAGANASTATTRTPAVGVQPVATTPTTTTTTTTLPPNQGDPTRPMTNSSGELPSLEVGKTTAMVRGQEVEAQVVATSENIVLRLPNNVEVIVAPTDALGNPLTVGSDGTIRVFGSQQIRIQMAGLIPGTTYTAYLFSEPVEIGRGVAQADGTIDELFEVPKEMSSGSHTLQVNGVGPDAEVVSVALGISVMETSNNTRLVVTLIGIAMLCALFIPLSLRRRLIVRR
jgi:hypothetical protein